MKLTIEAIYAAARAAGFSPDQATTWTAIALAESGGQTGALNDKGEHSVGLWQINVGVHTNKWGDLHDPYVNARAAYELSHHGTDMRPWTTTHASHAGTSTDYRTYLDDVSAVTGYAGDPRGVQGYGSPLPDPLPPSGPVAQPGPESTGYDQIDLGRDPRAKLDTDQDGLTDAFERLAGSSPDVADTDRDGLSDAHEVAVAHTDPLLADTDSDTLPDSSEVALGTSGSKWDSDSDGASDGVEVKYDSDPLHAEHGTVPEPVPQPTPPPTQISSVRASPGATTLADAFTRVAQAQRGDQYVFGAEASLDDADPDKFDCSELTQWAADQVGVTIPDGATYQYLELKGEGQLMSVDQALHTKGALLFYFSSEPTAGGGRPSQAHVAISLGDGRTIEAKGSSYGVNEFPAAGRFNYAGMIPQMAGETPAGTAVPTAMGTGVAGYDQIDAGLPIGAAVDSDGDGLSDRFEQMAGLDPRLTDSDGDGLDDALEQLGGPSAVPPVRPQPLSDRDVTAALAGLGLDGDEDADKDGLSNRYEVRHGLDAASADSDSDTLTDSTEVALGTDPTAVDSDADGLTDSAEVDFGTDPLEGGTPGDGWASAPDDGPGQAPDHPGGAMDVHVGLE